MDQDLLKKLEEAIEANYSDPAFGARELTRSLQMSHSSLFRKLRSLTGKSISQLIGEYRLKKALELLQTEDMTVSEVASKTGFNSPAYFSTSFRKHFGYSPGDAMAHRNDNPTIRHKIAPSRKLFIAGLSAVIIVGSILIFLAATGRFSKEISIAVLPFRTNSQSAEDATLTEILWEEVITTLAQIEVFDVKSAVSSGQYRDTAGKPIRQIRRKLKVKYIIEGSVSNDGDGVRLWIQMINVKEDRHFGAEDYMFPISELRDRMVDMAEHIAYELNTILKPEEKSAIMVRCSKSNESIDNYLVGNTWMSEKRVYPDKALPYYRKAIELDSTWVGPHLGLARVLKIMISYEPKEEYIQERLRAIEKAHELKPGPWSYSALASYYLDAGDLKKSRKFYKKGIRKYPDYANLNSVIARTSQKLGKWKEVEKRYLIFNKLAPYNASGYQAVGRTYEMLRDFPKAIKYFKQGISVNPNWSINYYNLADISLKWKGDPPEAR